MTEAIPSRGEGPMWGVVGAWRSDGFMGLKPSEAVGYLRDGQLWSVGNDAFNWSANDIR